MVQVAVDVDVDVLGDAGAAVAEEAGDVFEPESGLVEGPGGEDVAEAVEGPLPAVAVAGPADVGGGGVVVPPEFVPGLASVGSDRTGITSAMASHTPQLVFVDALKKCRNPACMAQRVAGISSWEG